MLLHVLSRLKGRRGGTSSLGFKNFYSQYRRYNITCMCSCSGLRQEVTFPSSISRTTNGVTTFSLSFRFFIYSCFTVNTCSLQKIPLDHGNPYHRECMCFARLSTLSFSLATACEFVSPTKLDLTAMLLRYRWVTF